MGSILVVNKCVHLIVQKVHIENAMHDELVVNLTNMVGLDTSCPNPVR